MQTATRKKPSKEVQEYLDLRKHVRRLLDVVFPKEQHQVVEPTFVTTLGHKILLDRLIIGVRSCQKLAHEAHRVKEINKWRQIEYDLIDKRRELDDTIRVLKPFKLFDKLPHTLIK
ncbi:MAG TPA: hypothetical protein PLF31_00800 [Candidatus Paceibacterota bacterium]|nr:hypothetical protein [Candidatus Paceibacterota bacterium]